MTRGLQVDGCSRVHGCGLGNPGVPSRSRKLVTVYETPSREQLQLSCHALDHVVAFTCRGTKVARAARAPPRLSLDCVRCGPRADPATTTTTTTITTTSTTTTTTATTPSLLLHHHHYYHHYIIATTTPSPSLPSSPPPPLAIHYPCRSRPSCQSASARLRPASSRRFGKRPELATILSTHARQFQPPLVHFNHL